ncbi:hypothetical protein ACS0TY_031870 [Phlomoides rotata]
MGSKREEERNEKIIRGLMKLPPNRRCINCNSLGPQYVCTNFWTFVCMQCSGIHREFTHRVKSVSMANFTKKEVDALQKGGNQRARELFLVAWDSLRHRHPDNSNADKVRQFIKNVYIDKKYAVEKSSDRPPRDPQSISSHEDEIRRASSYHSYSQSPPYDFQYEEQRYGKPGLSLARKYGSDRGLYEGKLSCFSSFSSPSRFSDQANDVLSPSSQSPFSETVRDFSIEIHGHTVLHNSDVNGGSNAGEIRRPQRTTSSGSIGSFDSMSFKSLNSMGLQEPATEAKQSVETSSDKISSFSSPPQSSTSTSFNGLDLFNEPFAPQNHTSIPTTVCSSRLPESLLAQSVDLFQQSHISPVPTLVEQQPSQTPPTPFNMTGLSQQQLVASMNSKASDVERPQNGGWATFGVSQNLLPMGSQTSIPAAVPYFDGNNREDFNPFSLGQTSFSQKPPSHEPSASTHTLGHDGLQNGQQTKNNSQLWNAFENSSGKQPVENVLKDTDQVAVLFASNANRSSNVGAYEALHNGGNYNTPYVTEPPLSDLSSYSSTVLHNFSMVPEVAGVHSVATVHKPTNPFDLPFDADLEGNNMTQFWDMSQLQAALPNNQMSATYAGDTNESWFPQNSVPSYFPGGVTFDPSNGSLGFITRQVPNAQILNFPTQGPIASTGGNPFA